MDKWSKEYITNLQQRTKWKEHHHELIKSGVLVLYREGGLPPLKWRIGRVLQTHPGTDNIVRAVTIKTATGNYKCLVAKLCVLLQQCKFSLKPGGFQRGRYMVKHPSFSWYANVIDRLSGRYNGNSENKIFN